jgi:hypothetical protein
MIRHFALAAPLTLIALFLPAFAQAPDNATHGLQLNATGNEEPLLEQMSEKGIYRVLLRSPQAVLTPQGATELEIVFLNASAPKPTAANIPQTETNATGASTPSASGFNDPGIIERTLPVESYDIAIYSEDGRELWKKADQPGLGGSGIQRIEITSNYTGPVIVNITDIRPGWDVGETATAEDLIDSVTFTATAVPEFPFVAILLAASVASGIAAARLWQQRTMK